MTAFSPPELWRPSAASIGASELGRFAAWVAERRGLEFGDPPEYDRIWRWSVGHLDQFWADVANWTGVLPGVEDERVLGDRSMPGAAWFPGTTINFAEQALRNGPGDAAPALIAVAEEGERAIVSWRSLAAQVGAFAATLRRLGVGRGDRVAGYLPNGVEAVVAFLGSASIGAVWSVCAPDFGLGSVLARFGQIEPKVLVAADGYRFNGRTYDRRETVAELAASLPGLEATVVVPRLGLELEPPGSLPWSRAVAGGEPPRFEALPFDHPLWIVYSSGTTGAPKAIVHGHGGIVLEQRKQAALHNDLRPGSRFYWYASTSWIMWNIAVSALLAGATVVLHDGAPGHPELGAQFELAERFRIDYLGTSAGYLAACDRACLRPGEEHDLAALKTIGSTGSPLPASTFGWVYEAVKRDVLLASASGGTDVASGFLGASPLLPVTAGELQRPNLGVAAAAWDEDGEPVVGRLGELVVTEPMPSMPLRFWGDDDGSRYRQTYFEPWPGVWRHGDWIEFSERGTVVIKGRSDSTLNRGGVRIGSAEIYAAMAGLPAIADSLVLGVELDDGGYWMPLFVRLAQGRELDDELVAEVRRAIREKASPRHAPDEVIAVPAIPRTRTGKLLEVPLKRLFQDPDADAGIDPGAVDDAAALAHFTALARARAGSAANPI